MTLERLWAGWRNAYVTGAVTGPVRRRHQTPASTTRPHCVFCRIAASGPPSADNGVLWVGRTTLVVLNAYPYASGHLMAVPLRHVGSLGDLTDEEATELWSAARLGVAAHEAAYGPEGSTSGPTWARPPGRASLATCTCTPCPDGRATPTS